MFKKKTATPMSARNRFRFPYFWITLGLFLFYSFVYARTNEKLHSLIKELKSGRPLTHAQWGVYAEYCRSGRTIVDFNGGMSLAPASGLKLFTSAAALHLLGEDFRFETVLYRDGRILPDGTLQGNIYIRGGGDPTLGSNRLSSSLALDSLLLSWVEALRNNSIKRIEGDIIADASLVGGWPVQAKWYWEDMGNYYGAGTSGLCFNENLYRLVFKPGKKEGDAVAILRTEPPVQGLTFVNLLSTGSKGSGDQAYIFAAPGVYRAVLRGTVPAGRKEFTIKGSLPDPALLAAQLFLKKLKESAIAVSGKAATVSGPADYSGFTAIDTTFSPPLKEIIYFLNKRSINLYAEQLAVILAQRSGKKAATEEGIKTIMRFLQDMGIDTGGIELYDASGLSRSDRITARAMVKLLSAMTRRPSFQTFYRSMGIAGDPQDIGHLKKFGRKTLLEKNARIKTGLINGVRSHSGYVTDRSGRLIAFSLIANNFNGRYGKIDKIHEKVLLKLAGLK